MYSIYHLQIDENIIKLVFMTSYKGYRIGSPYFPDGDWAFSQKRSNILMEQDMVTHPNSLVCFRAPKKQAGDTNCRQKRKQLDKQNQVLEWWLLVNDSVGWELILKDMVLIESKWCFNLL